MTFSSLRKRCVSDARPRYHGRDHNADRGRLSSHILCISAVNYFSSRRHLARQKMVSEIRSEVLSFNAAFVRSQTPNIQAQSKTTITKVALIKTNKLIIPSAVRRSLVGAEGRAVRKTILTDLQRHWPRPEGSQIAAEGAPLRYRAPELRAGDSLQSDVRTGNNSPITGQSVKKARVGSVTTPACKIAKKSHLTPRRESGGPFDVSVFKCMLGCGYAQRPFGPSAARVWLNTESKSVMRIRYILAKC